MIEKEKPGPQAVDEATLDAAQGGFSGPSGTGKTLSAGLLGKRSDSSNESEDHRNATDAKVASGGGNGI